MFLHDYLLACEISTVRTQTLKKDKHDYVKAGLALHDILSLRLITSIAI